jgi:hypothetical protein
MAKSIFSSYSDEQLENLRAQCHRNFWASSTEEEAEFWAKLEFAVRRELCIRKGRRLLARKG